MNYQPGAIEGQRIKAPSWTDEETITLKRLWDEGASASAIGATLGRSRNAIIGRVHRLGMQERRSSWVLRPPKPPKPAVLKLKPVKKPSSPAPKPYVPIHHEPAPLNVMLCEIPDNGCHWPMNEGGPYIFCGHERNGHRTYCDFHQSKSRTTHIFWGQK